VGGGGHVMHALNIHCDCVIFDSLPGFAPQLPPHSYRQGEMHVRGGREGDGVGEGPSRFSPRTARFHITHSLHALPPASPPCAMWPNRLHDGASHVRVEDQARTLRDAQAVRSPAHSPAPPACAPLFVRATSQLPPTPSSLTVPFPTLLHRCLVDGECLSCVELTRRVRHCEKRCRLLVCAKALSVPTIARYRPFGHAPPPLVWFPCLTF
jgi:hypothetical protein